ncbi:MAG TPA: hypothetical protein VJ729_07480 [Nitrososphaeraceae archaeon]|jgi:hypothetical protein|nr:hypothetical protein [Nitrososphaeraceae archaeon]
MKTKSRRVPAAGSSDSSGVCGKALERTNSSSYLPDEKNGKSIGEDNCKEKRNHCGNDDSSSHNDNDRGSDDENTIVPLEIDTHFQMYGKHVWDVEYGEKCPLCNKRIDEYGLCACGSAGE